MRGVFLDIPAGGIYAALLEKTARRNQIPGASGGIKKGRPFRSALCFIKVRLSRETRPHRVPASITWALMRFVEPLFPRGTPAVITTVSPG